MLPLLQIDVHVLTVAGCGVLRGIHQQVGPGQWVALLGAAGSGKSSLLRAIAGLEQRFEGQVLLAGSPVRALRRDIGLVQPVPRLLPWLNVAENVSFDLGRTLRRQPQTKQRVGRLLQALGLQDLADAGADTLSPAQAQGVALARALFQGPRVLLLDDPFTALGPAEGQALQLRLQAATREQPMCVLLATRSVDQALALAHRIWLFEPQPGPWAPRSIARDVAVEAWPPRDPHAFGQAGLRQQLLQGLFTPQAC